MNTPKQTDARTHMDRAVWFGAFALLAYGYYSPFVVSGGALGVGAVVSVLGALALWRVFQKIPNTSLKFAVLTLVGVIGLMMLPRTAHRLSLQKRPVCFEAKVLEVTHMRRFSKCLGMVVVPKDSGQTAPFLQKKLNLNGLCPGWGVRVVKTTPGTDAQICGKISFWGFGVEQVAFVSFDNHTLQLQ